MFLSCLQSSAQLLRNIDCFRGVFSKIFEQYNMASSGSSLAPVEDRFSIILSRLERIEASLSGLEDVKKLLVAIEDNTHPEGDSKCDFRNNIEDKVGFEIYFKRLFTVHYEQSVILNEKSVKFPHTNCIKITLLSDFTIPILEYLNYLRSGQYA